MKNRKNIYILLISIVVVIVGIVYLFNINNKDAISENKFSFTEIMNTDFSINNEEKNNINSILYEQIYEDDVYLGFNSNEGNNDLYTANAITQLIDRLNDKNIKKELNSRLIFLKNMNIGELDILNLTYYVNICKIMNYDYDREKVCENLKKYYDKDSNLFFINNKDDFINIKIVITAQCCNCVDELIFNSNFNIDEGVMKAYNDYNFCTGEEKTLYNSGGDILYCMKQLGLENNINISKHNEWFLFWKNKYESLEINEIEDMLSYSEFYSIAKIFDKNYSNKKMQEFYKKLNKEDIDKEMDYLVIYNSIKNIDDCNNKEFNASIVNNISDTINNGKIFKHDIDIQETLYGVLLAKKTDLNLNIEKLNNYIVYNYNNLENNENNYDKVSCLYFNIMVDQIVNNYRIQCSEKKIQSVVDDIIDDLNYEEEKDLITLRRAIEIIMDLQIHDYNLKITKFQKEKILKEMKKVIKKEKIYNSKYITDIYIIDIALNLNIVTKEEVKKIYNKLESYGGNKFYDNKNIPTDIVSTYDFIISMGLENNYDNLENQKEYISTLMVDDGLYNLCITKDATKNVTLKSILYGNSIYKLTVGGNKNDIN